jgi:hypothetical protein
LRHPTPHRLTPGGDEPPAAYQCVRWMHACEVDAASNAA